MAGWLPPDRCLRGTEHEDVLVRRGRCRSPRPNAGRFTLAWVMTSHDGPAGWSRGSDGSGLGDRNDIGSNKASQECGRSPQ